jgi:hypothetical protein
VREGVAFGLEPAVVCAVVEDISVPVDFPFLTAVLRRHPGSLWGALYDYCGLGTPAVEYADRVAVKLAIWRVRLR